MDVRARDALQTLIHAELTPALDEFAGELATLRQRVVALSQLAGLPADPGRDARQQAAAELRAQGLSTRAISAALGVDRGTVSADLRRLGVTPPERGIVGLDGRLTRGPRPAA